MNPWSLGLPGLKDGTEDIDDTNFEKEDTSFPFSLSPRWARRPKNGKLYGKKHIERYREEILALFERGCRNSSEKISAPAMWNALALKYPHRYDLPSEQEIR